MTVKITDISWGRYGGFEGPLYYGKLKFRLPSNPTANEKLLAVTTTTEGGTFEAVNAYDQCIISTGLIQMCEARYRLTSRMLSYIHSHKPELLDALKPALDLSEASFDGSRFLLKGQVANTLAMQQQIFLGGSTGKLGSWNEASKEHAKLWCVAMSNCLAQPEAQPLQSEYVAARLRSFVMKDAAAVIFDDEPEVGWVGALRSAYVSFSANNSLKARDALVVALKSTKAPKWSKDWCVAVLRELTFNSKFTIYPGRYNKIRPVIESIYGVDLPDFAEELKVWHEEVTRDAPSTTGEPDFFELEEVQKLLSDMGYDLGPKGVDGRMGPKTEDAIRTFQSTHGLVADAVVGPKTRAALLKAYRDLVCV